MFPKKKLLNKMYFKNDDEFYNFCVIPSLVVKDSNVEIDGRTLCYTDFEFTKEYLDAVNKKTMFFINDPNSSIVKNQCVSYRTITKPVANIYTVEDFYEYAE